VASGNQHKSAYQAVAKTFTEYKKVTNDNLISAFGDGVVNMERTPTIPLSEWGKLLSKIDQTGMDQPVEGALGRDDVRFAAAMLEQHFGGKQKITNKLVEKSVTKGVDSPDYASSRVKKVFINFKKTDKLTGQPLRSSSDKRITSKTVGETSTKQEVHQTVTNLDKPQSPDFEVRDGALYVTPQYMQTILKRVGDNAYGDSTKLTRSTAAEMMRALDKDLEIAAQQSGSRDLKVLRDNYHNGKTALEDIENNLNHTIVKETLATDGGDLSDLSGHILNKVDPEKLKAFMGFIGEKNPDARNGVMRAVVQRFVEESTTHEGGIPTVSHAALLKSYSKNKARLYAVTEDNVAGRMVLDKMVNAADIMNWGETYEKAGMFGAGILGLWGITSGAFQSVPGLAATLGAVTGARKIGQIVGDSATAKMFFSNILTPPKMVKKSSEALTKLEMSKILMQRLTSMSSLLASQDMQEQDEIELRYNLDLPAPGAK
jgi:hypothetical protein